MSSPFDVIWDSLNLLLTKVGEVQAEQPYVSPDIATVITQAVADIDLMGTISGMMTVVTSSAVEGITPLSFAWGTPPVGGGGGGAPPITVVTHKTEPHEFVKSASLPTINEDMLLGALIPHLRDHRLVVGVVGAISIIAEVLSVGQIDWLLNQLHSIYGLLDTPVIYSQIRDERISVEWRRPYRYYVESRLQNNLPPTPDLITFLVREVITLEDFKRALSYQGFSESVAQMYWDSHFIMPSTQEVYDMEALGMINEVQGKAQLVINDISPLWVDKIWDLRKRLPSRTETRMMLRRKKMPDELLERIFRFERLHPDYIEHFKYMLINWDIDSLYGRIINEAIGHYQDGLMNEETLRLLCTDHLASEAEVDAYTELAKMRQDERRREEQKDMWVALFKKNYRDRPSTIQALLSLNFDAEDIRIWLDKSEVDALPKLTIEQVEYGEEQEEEP